VLDKGSDAGSNCSMTLWFYEFAPSLDEQTYKLVDSVLDIMNKGTSVINYLIKFIIDKADTNLKSSASLINKIIVKSLIQPHHQNGLVAFVKKLYDNGYHQIADEICINVSALVLCY